MAMASNSTKQRFEIWQEVRDLHYIGKHLTREGQSVKNYIEILVKQHVTLQRKKAPTLKFENKLAKKLTK